MSISSAKTRDIPFFGTLETFVYFLNTLWFIHWGLINAFIGIHFFRLSNANPFLTGVLLGTPPISLLLTSFLFGWLSDIKGEKVILGGAFLTVIISDIVFFTISDSTLFLVAYIFFNLLMSCYSPAISRLSSRSVVGRDVFGKLVATSSLGYLVGSMASSILFDQYGMVTIFLLDLFSGMIGVLLCLAAPRGSFHQAERKKSSNGFSPSVSAGILLVVVGSLSLLNGITGPFYGLVVIEEVRAPSVVWGAMNAGATIAGVVASYLLGRFLYRKYLFPLLCSISSYILVFIVFYASSDVFLLFLVYSIPSYVGLAVVGPAWITDSTTISTRGRAMGLLVTIQNFALGIGAIFGGYLALMNGSFRGNFMIAFALSILVLLFTLFFFRDRPSQPKLTSLTEMV